MGDSSEGSEDQNAYRNVDSKGHDDEVSHGHEDSTGNWRKGHPLVTPWQII